MHRRSCGRQQRRSVVLLSKRSVIDNRYFSSLPRSDWWMHWTTLLMLLFSAYPQSNVFFAVYSQLLQLQIGLHDKSVVFYLISVGFEIVAATVFLFCKGPILNDIRRHSDPKKYMPDCRKSLLIFQKFLGEAPRPPAGARAFGARFGASLPYRPPFPKFLDPLLLTIQLTSGEVIFDQVYEQIIDTWATSDSINILLAIWHAMSHFYDIRYDFYVVVYLL